MASSILFSILGIAIVFVLIDFCTAPPPPDKGNKGKGKEKYDLKGKPHDNYKGNRRRIDDNALNALQNGCKKRGCKGQKDKAKRKRNAIKNSLTKARPGRPKLNDEDVERRFKKTWQAKKALFQLNGLPDVDPHDDGVMGGDMILNDAQLDRLLARTQGIEDANETAEVPLLDVEGLQIEDITKIAPGRRKRGDLLALDYYGGNKWPSTTINFYIDPADFTTTEANIIRNSLKSISSVTCLRFVEGWKYPLMEYVKTPSDTDSGTCGWANVGYQGNYNAININFASSICKSTLQGVIIHETLHSLGASHEHNRYDRDRFLKIDWNNVDSQSYDVFDKDDPHDYNPYCVPFDPLSIMIYDAYVGAWDSSKPAMTTVSYSSYYTPRMGMATVMTATDATLLKKMYCGSSTCKDKSTNCGWTACGDCATFASVCPKSCGKC